MKHKEITQNNRMRKNRKSFILALVFCLGVGFAALSSQLSITGNTSVKGQLLNVYLDNVSVKPGSVEAEQPEISESGDSIEYTVDLVFPGDFYEFSVDAINDGTIDVGVSSVSLTGISPEVAAYFSYELTYADGSSVNSNDILRANTTRTYRVLVKYRDDISGTSFSTVDTDLTLSFTINFNQHDSRKDVSQFTKLVKSNALSDSTIRFNADSSETNGRGLYLRKGTENQRYPIYYYRGAVTNNNAKFAGFCWKIVRTTDTGGTKLVYNGLPNATTGECDATGVATQLASNSQFNDSNASPAYNGYMYGDEIYTYESVAMNEGEIYGSSFEYDTENDEYILSNTKEGYDSTHRYTCLSSSTNCASVAYVHSTNSGTAYYITLTNGKSMEDALGEMQENLNDSVMKTSIDNWFNTTFSAYFTANNIDYEDYLEDTVWCNDRSADASRGYSLYGPYNRVSNAVPKLNCPNKNDAFTVSDTVNGNGALTYPVGLLTSDEAVLAGNSGFGNSRDTYLDNNNIYWTMSPRSYGLTGSDGLIVSAGVAGITVGYSGGVRPSISLKPNVKIATGGNGSTANPYEFIAE